MSAYFNNIAQEASELLNDSYDCDPEYNFTRWKKSTLAHYAQDAVNMIFMLYPGKFTDCKTIPLVKGRVQKLPNGCVKLTKVIGIDGGNSRASSSIASTAEERLGELFPSGCPETLTPDEYEVKEYSLEESSDNIFYVNPPAPEDGLEVTVICACAPDASAKDYEGESWMHNPIIEWVLYRAYSSEDESTQAANMAQFHLEHFYTIMKNYYQASMLLEGQVAQNVSS